MNSRQRISLRGAEDFAAPVAASGRSPRRRSSLEECMSEKSARSVHVASKSEALACHVHIPLVWMVKRFRCCIKLVSRGQSSSCVDIAFRMFGCGLPVPQWRAFGVGHRYSQSSCSQNITQCDIDFLMEKATGSNMLRGMKRHIKRSPAPLPMEKARG